MCVLSLRNTTFGRTEVSSTGTCEVSFAEERWHRAAPQEWERTEYHIVRSALTPVPALAKRSRGSAGKCSQNAARTRRVGRLSPVSLSRLRCLATGAIQLVATVRKSLSRPPYPRYLDEEKDMPQQEMPARGKQPRRRKEKDMNEVAERDPSRKISHTAVPPVRSRPPPRSCLPATLPATSPFQRGARRRGRFEIRSHAQLALLLTCQRSPTRFQEPLQRESTHSLLVCRAGTLYKRAHQEGELLLYCHNI